MRLEIYYYIRVNKRHEVFILINGHKKSEVICINLKLRNPLYIIFSEKLGKQFLYGHNF